MLIRTASYLLLVDFLVFLYVILMCSEMQDAGEWALFAMVSLDSRFIVASGFQGDEEVLEFEEALDLVIMERCHREVAEHRCDAADLHKAFHRVVGDLQTGRVFREGTNVFGNTVVVYHLLPILSNKLFKYWQ